MHRFTDLDVWSYSMDLAENVYSLTSQFPKHEMYGMSQQIRRAAVSIPSNIAEGAGRGTGPDFARFVRIAYGSACEVETQLRLAQRVGIADPEAVEELIDQVDRTRRMLYALATSISNA